MQGMWAVHVAQVLLVFAFRNLWNEWGDSNFQIFSQNCLFHHRRLELLDIFNVFLYIILSTTVSFLEDSILFLQCLLFFTFVCTLCMCVMYLTSFDGLF